LFSLAELTVDNTYDTSHTYTYYGYHLSLSKKIYNRNNRTNT